MIQLGENIRKQRIEKRLTQEQLAYEFGVSAQAISRWENGITYPDITLLPVIADFFETTLDELMGREKECPRDERESFFQSTHSLDVDESIAGHRQMLAKYPTDVYLQFSLSNLLYSKYKKSHDAALAKEVFTLCERVSRSGKPDLQCGANRLLVLIHADRKEYTCAKEIATSLPSFRCGRELMIAEALEGEEKRKHYQYVIQLLSEKIKWYQNLLD